MTPAKEMGLKIGDKIRALEGSGYINEGEVIELRIDDGTSSPYFWTEDKSNTWAFDIGVRKWEKVEVSKQFKAMKFWIGNDPKCSERVQKMLFDMGYKWKSYDFVMFTSEPFLIISIDGFIYNTHREDEFTGWDGEEINIDWLRTPKQETIELNNKVYYKSDLEEALKKIKPIEEWPTISGKISPTMRVSI